MSKTRHSEKDVVQVAGRGVIYITFAKLWFMATGWALVFLLPRIFKWASGGDAEEGQVLFGAYKLVVMGVSFINNGIITGTIQAVSKFTSEDESQAGAVRHTALKVQGLLGIALAVIYVAFAGLIADVLQSSDLAFLMRLSAGIIVAYSCYAVVIGSFNGQRMFNRQAMFDVVFSTVKTGLIVGLAAAGFEVLGTVLGFLIASVIIVLAAVMVSGLGSNGGFSAKRYFSFAAVLIGYTFLLNLVMSLDLFLLKGISSHLALSSGQSPEAASALGKALAGRYGAAQGLAFIPYQAILSIAFVAFPMVSKVTFMGDTAKTQRYIRSTLRFSAIFIMGLAAVFAAIPDHALGLIFPAEYQVAAESLGILSLGIAAFGLMVVSNTILNGSGHARKAMMVVITTLVAVIACVALLVMKSGPDDSALAATALGSTIGMIIGLVVSGVVVYRSFGAFLPVGTGVRVIIAAASLVAIGHVAPISGKLMTLVVCIALFSIYLVILAATREFRKEDVDQLKQIFKRQRA